MSQALFGKIFDLSYQNTDFLKYLTLIEWKGDSAERRLKAELTFRKNEYYSHFLRGGSFVFAKYFEGGSTDE